MFPQRMVRRPPRLGLLVTLVVLALSACGGEKQQQSKPQPLPEEEGQALRPGEYRSEVYLSANAAGKRAEDLRGGYFKHVAEIRVTVDGGPPFPTNAPRVPAGGGGCFFALPAAVLLVALRRRRHVLCVSPFNPQ